MRESLTDVGGRDFLLVERSPTIPRPLVFATVRAQEDARRVLGDNICVENIVQRGIEAGSCELFQLGGTVSLGEGLEANVWRCRSRLGKRLGWLVTDIGRRSDGNS
jgi:hypothetical protein